MPPADKPEVAENLEAPVGLRSPESETAADLIHAGGGKAIEPSDDLKVPGHEKPGFRTSGHLSP